MIAGPIGKAALAYWAIIFGVGFVLGTFRVLFLEDALGSLQAVLLELPLMLIASWLVARWLVRRFAINERGPALTMGAIAFALLMVSELALTAAMPDNSPKEWIARMTTLAGALGLAGQLAFGLMPLLVVKPRR